MDFTTGLAFAGLAFVFFYLSNSYKDNRIGLFEVFFNLGHIFVLASLVITSNIMPSFSLQFSEVIKTVFMLLIWIYFFVFITMFIKMWKNMINFYWRMRTLKGHLY
jgi:hypothetical protein